MIGSQASQGIFFWWGYPYGWENGNQGNNGRNPKPGWDHQFKRDYIETHFVVDLTSPYNNILMSYGEQSQIQRYTYGLDLISMDFQSLSDHDNGWIPRGTETTYSGQFERIYYLLDELGSTTRVIGENGKSSAHYNYDEFGRPLPEVKFDPNCQDPITPSLTQAMSMIVMQNCITLKHVIIYLKSEDLFLRIRGVEA